MNVPQCVDQDGYRLVLSGEIRCLIRLLVLHKNNLIPKEYWNEFLDMPNNRQQKLKDPNFVKYSG